MQHFSCAGQNGIWICWQVCLCPDVNYTLKRWVEERWTISVNFQEFVCVHLCVGHGRWILLSIYILNSWEVQYPYISQRLCGFCWQDSCAAGFSFLRRETDAINWMKCCCSSPANRWQFFCPCPYLLFRYLSLGMGPMKLCHNQTHIPANIAALFLIQQQ